MLVRARQLGLVFAWVLIAAIVVFETLGMRDYLAMIDDSGTLPTDSLPFRHVVPADYADAYTWTRYAVAVDSSGDWRIRRTDIDNAPVGREVHWNSAFVHLVAAAGRLRSAATGEPLSAATERARVWFNLPLFMSVVVLFSWIAASRFGTAAGIVLAFGMLGHRWFYDGFAPGYVDHHGLLTAATFGVVFGATLMGAGWRGIEGDSILPRSRRDARIGAAISAASGAVGLWISAASVIPTIAFVGLAGLGSGLWLSDAARHSGEEFDGAVWRLWGVIGCAGSLLAYFLEYAPHDLSMRLEVNHPLYAFAWLGGAELVATLVEWKTRGRVVAGWRAPVCIAALLAPAVAIAFGGSRVFVPLDPRMARVHSAIKEFLSVPDLLRLTGGWMAARLSIGFLMLLPAVLMFRRSPGRVVIAFLGITSLAAAALACWEVRWWLTASGPQLCLLLVAIQTVMLTRPSRVRWIVTGLTTITFAGLALARIEVTRSDVENRAVGVSDALQPMYRDAAAAIRAADPDGPIVLAASPNASTSIGYFGRFAMLASLYWENFAGLEAAARIFSAASDDEARRLMAARGVTHIAAISPDNFLETYFRLAKPDAPAAELRHTFGFRLLRGDSVPRWLRPIPFRPRFPPGDTTSEALLFKVVPEQSDFDALWNSGVAEVARGRSAAAERDFGQAIGATAVASRPALFETAGTVAYRWGDHRLAVQLLDSSFSLRPSAQLEINIAWILATSRDDGVRNGAAALARAQRLARSAPNDSGVLDALAAALAETGQFTEAVAVTQRMAELAQVAGDAAGIARARARLASYSAGRPWRQ